MNWGEVLIARRSEVLVVRAYLKAHGLTATGFTAYLLAWLLIMFASRLSISALGLQLDARGSASMDTVAAFLTLIPAASIARCIRSRTPDLEAVRSRSRQPFHLLWVASLCLASVAIVVIILPMLHSAIDKSAFFATWCLVLGLTLTLAALLPISFAMAGSFAAVAVFTTPGLVPWDANLIYNVHAARVSGAIGVALLAVGVLLCALWNPGGGRLSVTTDA